MLESLVISLVLTIVIEVILALIIGVRGNKNIINVIWINCLTNPIVVGTTNLVYLISNSLLMRNIVLILLEILVVLVEGILFRKFLEEVKIKPLILSLYLNGLSFGIGLIINLIIN